LSVFGQLATNLVILAVTTFLNCPVFIVQGRKRKDQRRVSNTSVKLKEVGELLITNTQNYAQCTSPVTLFPGLNFQFSTQFNVFSTVIGAIQQKKKTATKTPIDEKNLDQKSCSLAYTSILNHMSHYL
jgi:hypothetical protein